jgi:hypothetical protein
MYRQVVQIVAIGGKRVLTRAALGYEHVEKQFD